MPRRSISAASALPSICSIPPGRCRRRRAHWIGRDWDSTRWGTRDRRSAASLFGGQRWFAADTSPTSILGRRRRRRERRRGRGLPPHGGMPHRPTRPPLRRAVITPRGGRAPRRRDRLRRDAPSGRRSALRASLSPRRDFVSARSAREFGAAGIISARPCRAEVGGPSGARGGVGAGRGRCHAAGGVPRAGEARRGRRGKGRRGALKCFVRTFPIGSGSVYSLALPAAGSRARASPSGPPEALPAWTVLHRGLRGPPEQPEGLDVASRSAR